MNNIFSLAMIMALNAMINFGVILLSLYIFPFSFIPCLIIGCVFSAMILSNSGESNLEFRKSEESENITKE